jgi:hypothetical protein
MPKAKLNKIYALIEQGLEDECIDLLKKYNTNDVEALQKQRSIWHLAIRSNLLGLIKYLAAEFPKNIDYVDESNLTPWALAVTLNNATIAEVLVKKGADAGILLNKEGQTLLHIAVDKSDIALLENCVNCKVPGNIKDEKGFTAQFYAHAHKKSGLMEILKKLNYSKENDGNDLCNSVIKNDSQSLQILLDTGFDLKKINHPTLLDRALIFKSKEAEAILRAAGDHKTKTDEEIQEIRRSKFGKKSNSLLTTYAMTKLSLKKSKFKISWWILLAISLVSAIVTSFIASSLIVIFSAGILSGMLYAAWVGKMHFSKVNKEKELKSNYTNKLDQKRTLLLKLSEQLDTDKHADLIEELTDAFNDEPLPTFQNTEQGDLAITQDHLLMMDSHIKRLKMVDIEVPDSARATKSARI